MQNESLSNFLKILSQVEEKYKKVKIKKPH